MNFDQTSFRDALGRFATGIVVVTGVMPDDSPTGITVNAFSSVSLDPPLVLVCIGKRTEKLKAFTEKDHFAVNILSEDQMEVSNAFARTASDSFDHVKHHMNDKGCALFDDALVQMECAKHEIHDAGDHYIVIGRVEGLHHSSEKNPLLFFKGGYRTLGDDI